MTQIQHTYYFTFMQKQAFKNKYVIVIATNEATARQAMFEHFGDKWMTFYIADKFEGQIEQFGLTKLCEIGVINHGTEDHPSLEYVLV